MPSFVSRRNGRSSGVARSAGQMAGVPQLRLCKSDGCHDNDMPSCPPTCTGKLPFETAPKDDRNLPDMHLALYNDVVVFDQVHASFDRLPLAIQKCAGQVMDGI